MRSGAAAPARVRGGGAKGGPGVVVGWAEVTGSFGGPTVGSGRLWGRGGYRGVWGSLVGGCSEVRLAVGLGGLWRDLGLPRGAGSGSVWLWGGGL